MPDVPFDPEKMTVVTEYNLEQGVMQVVTFYDPGWGFNILHFTQTVDDYQANPDRAHPLLLDAYTQGKHLK